MNRVPDLIRHKNHRQQYMARNAGRAAPANASSCFTVQLFKSIIVSCPWALVSRRTLRPPSDLAPHDAEPTHLFTSNKTMPKPTHFQTYTSRDNKFQPLMVPYLAHDPHTSPWTPGSRFSLSSVSSILVARLTSLSR